METENKDWKPEVGGKAWAINRRSLSVVECVINAIYGTEPYVVADVSSRTRGGSWLDKAIVVYPTAEAALAANPLKVYDLEGKEVLISRAEPDFLLRALTDEGRVLSLLEKQFYDFCKQDPENVAKFALSLIGGGAAIGGKSDQREGGC